jgi:hypothetical protein
MKYPGGRQPPPDQAGNPFPRPGTATLAAPPQGSQPELTYLCAETVQTGAVARYSMVVKPSLDYRTQPPAHLGQGLMQPLPQPLTEGLQLGAHPLACRLSLDRKRPLPRRPAVVREAEEGERFRLALTALAASFDTM